MKIQIPQGAHPGMTIQVQLSDGRKVALQVPPGAVPGSFIQFAVPGAAAPPPQQQQMYRPPDAAARSAAQLAHAQRNPVAPQPRPGEAAGSGYQTIGVGSGGVAADPAQQQYERQRQMERDAMLRAQSQTVHTKSRDPLMGGW